MHNNPPPPQPMKQKSSGGVAWVDFCYHIVYIILGIAIMVIAYNADSGVSSSDEAMHDFTNNWKTVPLVDIQTALSSCPPGYETLITRKWPGTGVGCDCTYSWNFLNSNLQTSSCSYNETRSGCRDVRPVNAIPLEKFYSYKICGKRDGFNFLDTPRPTKPFATNNVTCSAGFKVCGTGDADHSFCGKIGVDCPINDIYITKPGEQAKPGYKTVPLDQGQLIAFTTEAANLPVVRFRLTESKVCANPSQYAASSGRSLYKLLNSENYGSCSDKVGGSNYDSDYELLGTVREDRLFQDNGILAVTATLPYYPAGDAIKYDWNLYDNRYNFWNTKCEKTENVNKETMVVLIDDSTKVVGYQDTLFWIALVHVGFKH